MNHCCTVFPHSGHRSGEARRSYPHFLQQPAASRVVHSRYSQIILKMNKAGKIPLETSSGQIGNQISTYSPSGPKLRSSTLFNLRYHVVPSACKMACPIPHRRPNAGDFQGVGGLTVSGQRTGPALIASFSHHPNSGLGQLSIFSNQTLPRSKEIE